MACPEDASTTLEDSIATRAPARRHSDDDDDVNDESIMVLLLPGQVVVVLGHRAMVIRRLYSTREGRGVLYCL